MKRQEFIELFVEELEIENTIVTEDTELSSLDEWDSMGAMILIGLTQDNFGVKIASSDLKSISTIKELMDKIGSDKFE